MKKVGKAVAVLIIVGACGGRAEDVKSRVQSLIYSVCVDSQCIRDSEVEYVRSHRKEAIPILEDALKDHRKFTSPGTIGFWTFKLAPYSETTIVDLLVNMTKDKDDNVSSHAWEVLSYVAGTGDPNAKKQIIPQIELTMALARGLKGSPDPELKKLLEKLSEYVRETLGAMPNKKTKPAK